MYKYLIILMVAITAYACSDSKVDEQDGEYCDGYTKIAPFYQDIDSGITKELLVYAEKLRVSDEATFELHRFDSALYYITQPPGVSKAFWEPIHSYAFVNRHLVIVYDREQPSLKIQDYTYELVDLFKCHLQMDVAVQYEDEQHKATSKVKSYERTYIYMYDAYVRRVEFMDGYVRTRTKMNLAMIGRE